LLSVPLFSLVSGVLDPPDLLSFPTRRSSDLICYGDPATGANVGAKPLLHLRPKSHHDEIQAPRLVLDTTPSVCIVRSLALQRVRSEEHTSELQSRENLVCRLLLEKKKDESYG